MALDQPTRRVLRLEERESEIGTEPVHDDAVSTLLLKHECRELSHGALGS